MVNKSAIIEFPSTRWLLVARAARADGETGREALEELLRAYMRPLLSYLVRARRLPAGRAEDLLQEFLLDKVMEQNLLSRAEQARGKFRTFLLASLNRFVADQFRHEERHKRWGGEETVSLDQASASVADGDGPQSAFDLDWARQVLDGAVCRMRQACQQSGRADVWGVFEARVLLPTLQGQPPMPYGELVARFSLTCPEQAANVLVTGKRMFLRALRSVIAEYTSNESEIDEEIADLQTIVARGAGQVTG